MRLTVEQAALVVCTAAALALVGVPRVDHGPPGGIRGRVTGEAGMPLADVEVALFADAHPGLVELVRTDREGRFAFRQVPEGFRVFASAPEGSARIGAWGDARRASGPRHVELALRRGRPVRARVLAPDGRPAPRAELRVFDADQRDAAVARTLTDDAGACTLVLPARAHLAVLADGAATPVWWLDGTWDATGGELRLALPSRAPVRGRVSERSGAGVRDLVVTAWSEDGARFEGWTTTGPDGTFRLDARGEALLRLADPTQRHLPLAAAARAGTTPAPLTVDRTDPGHVVAERDGLPTEARVWSREPDGPWGWGARTSARGRTRLALGAEPELAAFDAADPAARILVRRPARERRALQPSAPPAEEDD